MPPAVHLNVQSGIRKRGVRDVNSSGRWLSGFRLNPVFLFVFKAHFVEKCVQLLLSFGGVAMKPSSEPLAVSVPAVAWVLKESLFACTYCASCNDGILHRIVADHSLTIAFPDLCRHDQSFGITCSPMTIPGVYPLHRLATSGAVEH